MTVGSTFSGCLDNICPAVFLEAIIATVSGSIFRRLISAYENTLKICLVFGSSMRGVVYSSLSQEWGSQWVRMVGSGHLMVAEGS